MFIDLTKCNRTRKHGFTLIELLVVIAIIAILAAILFPVFAKAREKARQITCASNEKQIGLGILQYVQDFDETYPVNNGPSEGSNCCGWADAITPYTKASGIFKCPDDPSSFAAPQVAISYAINFNLIYLTGGNGLTAVSLARQSAPASTILVMEVQGRPYDPTANYGGDYSPSGNLSGGFWGGGLPNNNGAYATGDPPGKTLTLIPAGTIHTSGSNFLACDGHVKYLTPSRISGGIDAATPAGALNTNSESGAGTSCMDNVPADSGNAGCPNPNTATLTTSSI